MHFNGNKFTKVGAQLRAVPPWLKRLVVSSLFARKSKTLTEPEEQGQVTEVVVTVCKPVQHECRCGNSRSRAVVAIRLDFLDTSRPWIGPAWKEKRHSGSRVCTHSTASTVITLTERPCLFHFIIIPYYHFFWNCFPLGLNNTSHTSLLPLVSTSVKINVMIT